MLLGYARASADQGSVRMTRPGHTTMHAAVLGEHPDLPRIECVVVRGLGHWTWPRLGNRSLSASTRSSVTATAPAQPGQPLARGPGASLRWKENGDHDPVINGDPGALVTGVA